LSSWHVFGGGKGKWGQMIEICELEALNIILMLTPFLVKCMQGIPSYTPRLLSINLRGI